MEITIGMKRILPTLLMSGLLCMLFATPVAAQTENSTLHPEATHGVALWGKHSRQTTHTSQKKEQTSLSYKEEHKDTAPEVNAAAATFRSVALPLQNGQPDSTLRQEFDEQSSLQKEKNKKLKGEESKKHKDQDDEDEDDDDASNKHQRQQKYDSEESKVVNNAAEIKLDTTSSSDAEEVEADLDRDDEEEEEEEKKEVSYVPRVDGAVKAKLEVSLYDGEYRFNVRNTRFGVSGNVSPNMFYRIQVDFNNEGKLNILDSYVGYRTGGLDIRLGQQQYHFSTELDRGPNTNIFANRSFLAKYLTSYYGSELSGTNIVNYVNTLGSRDLGLMTTYQFKKGLPIPIKLYFGIFNGSGINNPSWNKTVNLIGRVEVGTADAFRAAVSYYNGSAPRHQFVIDRNGTQVEEYLNQKLNMIGTELHYVNGGFFIEGEFARRYLQTRIEDDKLNTVMTAALVHSYYRFEMPHRFVLNYIAPMLRWDIGNNMDYLNTLTSLRETVDANRITVGVNFGFGKKLIHSELRLNYEKYFVGNQPDDFPSNKLLHDKFTLEVVAAF